LLKGLVFGMAIIIWPWVASHRARWLRGLLFGMAIII
jgi:hypothetical protein